MCSFYPQNFRHDPLKIGAYIENIRKLRLGPKSREAMLGENARQLLNL